MHFHAQPTWWRSEDVREHTRRMTYRITGRTTCDGIVGEQ
jgi:hypothetical protein